jgi:cobalt-zinc-cadmium efflux system outer membrane protein
MSTKSRGITICLVFLMFIIPFGGPLAAESTEQTSDNSGNGNLAKFVREIVDVNPTVNAALAALDASWAYEAASGRPLYNPELELEAEDADSKTRALGLSQTLDWGGKRRARLTVAEAERRSVEADVSSVRWQVAVELLSALSDYQTESEVNALAAIRVATMQDFAAVSRRRFDAGDISQIELDLAVLAYTQARMQLATAAADFAESKQAVTSLVFNVPETRWPSLGAEFAPPSTGSVTAEDLVLTLPHVRAAQQQVEAASARVSLRERERRVDPTLTLRGGKEDDETLVGLNVTIPLPIRNSFRHEVTAASAERRQAQQVFSDVARRAYTRFLGAQERYRISQGAWQDWRETGDVSLQSQGALLKRLWEAGELSTTDYLVQLKQTLDTEESALELRRSMWGAWFEWMTASGQIESWLGTGS